MVTRPIEIVVCDRHGTDVLATQTRQFSLGKKTYTLDLCDDHAARFDREQAVWVQFAEEVEPPRNIFTREHVERSRRSAELRGKVQSPAFVVAAPDPEPGLTLDQQERLAEEQARLLIPGAMAWTVTDHAWKRLREREVSITEVLQTAAQPEHTYAQPHRGPDLCIYRRGNCRLIINERMKWILTVTIHSEEDAVLSHMG